MRSEPRTGTVSPSSVITLGASLVVLSFTAQAKLAAACVLEPLRLHRSDASLAQIDTAPPEAPVVIAASAYRRSGLTCGEDICVANNCGDMGGVAIDLAAGDDQTPPNRIGYRLELVGGVIPPALRSLIGVDLAGPTPLRLRLAFDEVPSVDATLRVIAIDGAGNESAPSAPFSVGFDGCTLAAEGDQCEQNYDADAEYAASGGTLVVSRDGAPETSESSVPGLALQTSAASLDEAHGCSLPSGAPGGSALSVLAPAALAWLAARRRR